VLRAAALALALLAPAASAGDAERLAKRISSAGPRPAGSKAEGRAHALMARVVRRAGLRVRVQRFAVPGRGRSRNVIGAFETSHRCLQIVVAHTDSMPAASGANDNASRMAYWASWPRGCGESARPATYGWWPAAPRSGCTRAPPTISLSLDEVGRGSLFWLRSSARRPCDRPGRLQRSALELARRIVERALT
jgi:hypothetical protein